MSNRRKLQRVLKRDKRLCGVHMGGCGRPIRIGEPTTRDHIVPTALYSKVATKPEFDQPWNWQPMHKACNEANGSAIHGWPRFDCDCHYLQIHGRDLYVHTTEPLGKGRHKLLENIVSEDGRARSLKLTQYQRVTALMFRRKRNRSMSCERLKYPSDQQVTCQSG